MKKVTTIFTIILFISTKNIFAQDIQKDVLLLQKLTIPKNKIDNNFNYVKELAQATNEIQLISSLFFVIYKVIFSSQDVDACVFTPSCSVYAIQSIKKKGIIVGLLNASDRLQRCHPGANKHYPIDPKTNKLYDPVK